MATLKRRQIYKILSHLIGNFRKLFIKSRLGESTVHFMLGMLWIVDVQVCITIK